jgi:hypothetical protein
MFYQYLRETVRPHIIFTVGLLEDYANHKIEDSLFILDNDIINIIHAALDCKFLLSNIKYQIKLLQDLQVLV